MEFLKSIFENKALTYEEFTSLLKDNKEINIVNAANGEYVKKEDLETKNSELVAIKKQLKEANSTIQSYKEMDIESIKRSADEWKNKYETETQELNSKIQKQKYEFAAKEYLGNFKFINDRVKNSILNDFLEKEFKFEDNKFLGADDWINSLKENEPEVFKDINNTGNDPVFTNGFKNNPGKGQKLSLQDMMKAKNENPNMEINFNK